MCLHSVHHFSDELKELEAKLRAGYVNRERAAQLAEKQASQMLDAVNYYICTLSPYLSCILLIALTLWYWLLYSTSNGKQK